MSEVVATGQTLRRNTSRFAVIIWLATAVMLLIVKWPAIMSGTLFDPDDELRLVQVRDLLGGQAWWDLAQHRINPAAGGVLMHWSRIVDLPIAAGIALLRPLVGTAMAESLVVVIWPLLTLGAVFAVAHRTFKRLGRDDVVVLGLALLATDHFILFQLSPMRIDHHGWQILLGLGLMANALAAPTRRNGVIGGLIASLLLSISIEGLPWAALFAGMAACEWAWSNRRDVADRLLGYLSALAAGTIVLQFATRGPTGLTIAYCDSLSPTYMAAFVAAAAVFAAGHCLNRLPRSAAGRVALLVAIGAASVAALLLVAPNCSRGPFSALEPIVVQYWYVHILEGQPLWLGSLGRACYTVAPAIVGLVGILIGWRQASDADSRRRWALLGVAGFAGMISSIIVLRTGSTAHAILMPGCALVGITLWQWSRRQSNAVLRIVTAMSVLIAVPVTAGVASSWAIALVAPDQDLAKELAKEQADTEADMRCVRDGDALRLDRLAPATILTPLDLGPVLVRTTHHGVVATGHHRNNLAMAATLRTFMAPTSEARARMRPLGATMIAVCGTDNDLQAYAAAPGRSLSDDLLDGRLPGWIESVPMSPGSALKVWRIAPLARRASQMNVRPGAVR